MTQCADLLRAITVSEKRPPSVARAGVPGSTSSVVSISSPDPAIGDAGGVASGRESAAAGSSPTHVPRRKFLRVPRQGWLDDSRARRDQWCAGAKPERKK